MIKALEKRRLYGIFLFEQQNTVSTPKSILRGVLQIPGACGGEWLPVDRIPAAVCRCFRISGRTGVVDGIFLMSGFPGSASGGADPHSVCRSGQQDTGKGEEGSCGERGFPGLSWGQRVVLYQSGSLSEWHF